MLQSTRAAGLHASGLAHLDIRNIGRRITALFGFLALLNASAAHAVFVTPGKFDVSPTGAASYTIPIAVPPGTGGMVPSLALSYSSQGGNGLLGLGWSLSGLSAITRCSKTLAQDNIKQGITYTDTDKYCLDGQRLIAISGAYGADGAEYRTERDGFSKIVSNSAVGSTSPTSFTVWTKSGQIIEFGNTLDSAIEAQGKTAIRVWAVNKIADTVGNYLTVSYTEDEPNGQYYPSRIDYTGNPGNSKTPAVAPYASVRLEYAARPDVNEIAPVYVSDSVIKQTQRLTNVKTYVMINNVDTLIKDYQLGYEAHTAGQPSRLISVTECDGAANCLSPTTLTWQKGTGGEPYGVAQTIGWGLYGDVNGDGVTDRVYTDVPLSTNYPSYSGKIYVALGGGAATVWGNFSFSCSYNFRSSYLCPVLQFKLGDMNGDGKQDLITSNEAGGAKVRLSSGTTFNAPVTWGGVPQWVGDVNGDGKDDFVWLPAIAKSPCSSVQQPVYVGISTGTGLLPAAPWGTLNAGCHYDYQARNYVYYSANIWGELGDVDGDGRKDLVFSATSVARSTGSGFVMPTAIIQTGSWIWGDPAYGWVTDINGDGLADLLTAPAVTNSTSGEMRRIALNAALSNGKGFGTSARLTDLDIYCGLAGNCPYSLYFADFNNDGREDLRVSSMVTHARMTQFHAPDVVSKITNGLGAETSLTYQALSDAATYTPESGSMFPYRDLGSQVGLYVVSSVASSNGIGGHYTSTYSYAGGKTHVTGGGFLGFHTTTSTDTQTGIVSTTTYNQEYPHQGLPLSVEKKTGTGVPLNNVANTWEFVTNTARGVQYHVPQLTQTVESSYELDGTPTSTVTTCTQYASDAVTGENYGDPTEIVVWSETVDCKAPPLMAGRYVKKTVNEYFPADTARWILGRLKKATVTSVTP